MTILLLDYAFVIAGVIGIAAGVWGRKFYYGEFSGTIPAPVKSAKLFFVAVGVLFVAIGLGNLFGFIPLKLE